MEVGGLARERLVGGAQGFEGGVPGIGKDHKPDDASHQGVVHNDKDDDAGQGLVGATHTCGVSLGDVILHSLSSPCLQTLGSKVWRFPRSPGLDTGPSQI